MQVVFHLGVHCTDEDRLLKCLLKNRDRLAAEGVGVPPPSRYRLIFRDMMAKLRGKPAEADLQALMLDAMLDEAQMDRLVFSHEFFLAAPAQVVSPKGFYANSDQKVAAFANLFPEATCEFHISLRNPATLIPTILDKMKDRTYADFMSGQKPEDLRWLPVIARMVEENPGRRICVWSNEDTPLIWSDLLRSLAGVSPSMPLDGEFDFVAGLMSPQGASELARRLAEEPPQTRGAHHRMLASVLTDFAKPDALDMPISLPGWSEDLIEDMTLNYEADLEQISSMHGVEFVSA